MIRLTLDVLLVLALIAAAAVFFGTRASRVPPALTRTIENHLEVLPPSAPEAHPVTPPVVDEPAGSPPPSR